MTAAGRQIDVLLISPRWPQGQPGYGGDHAYTDTLLACPPEGVRYHHYEDLIASGHLRVHVWLNRLVSRLCGYRILPPDLWAVYLVSGFQPDLVHVYGFSAYLGFPGGSGAKTPVILSQGTGGAADLLHYLGWGEMRVRRWRRWESLLLRVLHIYNSSLNPRDARRIVVWSRFSREMHLWDRNVRPEQIEVLYPGLALPPARPHRQSGAATTFLFVASDFERKNGPMAIEAFREVRQRHPDARLLIVGNPPPSGLIPEPGVVYEPFAPRQELYERIYPQADVLVLPSRAEGFGLVLLEAMSFGMPVIGVDAWAMPEVVTDGMNGFLIPPDSVDALADRMARLAADEPLRRSMGSEALRTVRERFSIERHNRRLREVYLEALGASGDAQGLPSEAA